jgi:hypothetical protein
MDGKQIGHVRIGPPRWATVPGVVGGFLLLGLFVFHLAVGIRLPSLDPALLIGQGLVLCIAWMLAGEAWRLHTCRRDLARFPSADGSTWADQAWEACRRQLATAIGITPKDYLVQAEEYCKGLVRELDLRWWRYFAWALAPFLVGGLVGLQNLNLRRETTPSYNEVFLPLTVGTVEAFLLGLWAFLLSLGWNRLLNDFRAALPALAAGVGPTLAEREAELARREEELRRREEAVLHREQAAAESSMSDLVRGETFHNGETEELLPAGPNEEVATSRVPRPLSDDDL